MSCRFRLSGPSAESKETFLLSFLCPFSPPADTRGAVCLAVPFASLKGLPHIEPCLPPLMPPLSLSPQELQGSGEFSKREMEKCLCCVFSSAVIPTGFPYTEMAGMVAWGGAHRGIVSMLPRPEEHTNNG